MNARLISATNQDLEQLCEHYRIHAVQPRSLWARRGLVNGDLIERIDGDVMELSNFFSQMVVRVLGNILLLLGILLVLAGFQLITTGFIAESLMRTYYESQRKPTYRTRKTINL